MSFCLPAFRCATILSVSERIPLPPLLTTEPVCCSVCGCRRLSFLGVKDLAYSCNDHFQGQGQFAFANAPVRYHRCDSCGFTSTSALDAWSREDFKAHIYNEAYVFADPIFEVIRPQRNSEMVSVLWGRSLLGISVLDYGGGDGAFSRFMQERGFSCVSVDAFHGGDVLVPGTVYELVTCFEVIEHVPHLDLAAWFAGLVAWLSPSGTLLLSTELLDAHPGIDNHYIAPRNGHISLHTGASLRALAASHGLTVYSVSNEMHLFRRT